MERVDCRMEKPYWAGAKPFPRKVAHPIFYTQEEIERARGRVARHDWAKSYLDGLLRRIDSSRILEMPDDAIREGLPNYVGFALPRCPVDRGQRSWRHHYWAWSSDDPEHVRCSTCGTTFPGPEHTPTGAVEVVGPSGGVVPYEFWEDDEGFRYFFQSYVSVHRKLYLTELAVPLALAYVLTGNKVYATKAALILGRMAEVYPDYPAHGLGTSYNQADRKGYYENHFYKDPPFPFVSGRWGDGPFSDGVRAFGMGQAYDLISTSGEIEALSEQTGRDVRTEIERDLLYEAACHVTTVQHPATNYDGNRIRGLGLLGRLLDEPSITRQAYDLYRNLIDNAFCYDNYWHEDTVSYFSMIMNGVLRTPEILGGPGGIDVKAELPHLRAINTVPLGLFFPDGRVVPVNDTWAGPLHGRGRNIGMMRPYVEAADEMAGLEGVPVSDQAFALFQRSSEAERCATPEDLLSLIPENALLPGAGDAVLGVGRSEDAVRLTFSYGPWGGHHHRDSLGIGLSAFQKEQLSDIGYTWTVFRPWTTTTASHNTVVVDGTEQTTAGGRLLAYRPASADQVGFVSAEVPDAYEQTTCYRRSLFLIPSGDGRGYLVDVFEVAGGNTHDYLLHGSADFDQAVTTEVPLVPTDEGLATNREGGVRYDYVRDLSTARATGDCEIRISGEGAFLDLRLLGVEDGTLVAARGPSIRRAQEQDAELEYSWREMVCLRRESSRSQFVTTIEAHTGLPALKSAWILHRDGSRIVVELVDEDSRKVLVLDPEGRGFSVELPDGRMLELEGRAAVVTEGQAEIELIDASRCRFGGITTERERHFQGHLTSVVGDITGHPEKSVLVADSGLPDDGAMNGKMVYVTHPSGLETVYEVASVERDGEGARILLAGMPRFIWGRGEVKSGGIGTFEATVDQPKHSAYAGCRVRIAGQVCTIAQMPNSGTFETVEQIDFGGMDGEAFQVFSTAPGDSYRIVL